jgi:hypothetical protein
MRSEQANTTLVCRHRFCLWPEAILIAGAAGLGLVFRLVSSDRPNALRMTAHQLFHDREKH